MASPQQTDNTKMSLTASYTSPTNAPFTLTHPLAAPPSGTANPSVPDKVKYLSDLRSSIVTLQQQINMELTQRMDEDKVSTGDSATAAKDEENYGEEAQEEED